MDLCYLDYNNRQAILEQIACQNNKNNPKVTIIVATYNNEIFIDRCLISLVKQTLNDIEIIVVNDGSTDNTKNILAEYEKKDCRIKIIHQENRKQGAARNKGLEIANGEFVTFVDSDDWVDEDYCEKLYNAAVKNNVNIASACATRDYDNKVKEHLVFEKEEIYKGSNDIIRGLKMHLETHSKLYRFENIKNIRFPEEVFYEDAPYTLEVIIKEQSMVTVPDAHYHYYSNSNSTIKTGGNIAKQNDKIEMNLLLLDIAKKNNIDIGKFPILKERHLLWGIKHYLDYKEFYLFGIKIKTLKIPFNNEKTFVIFNTSYFGDVLLCNSLCQNIKRAFPDSKIVFVVNKGFEDVARYQECVDDVVVFDKSGIHKGFFGILKFVRDFKYKNIFASVVTYHNSRNKTIAKMLKSHFIKMGTLDKSIIHTQIKHNNLLKGLTNRNIKNFPIKYDVPDNIANPIKNLKYIALCTTSKKPEKDMPINTAIDLINKINSETDYKVVYVGAGKNCEKYAHELENLGCDFINMVNKTSILELGALLKDADALISVDTGTMHFGYAIGTPTVCLFYQNDLAPFWAPDKNLYNVEVLVNDINTENIYSSLKKLLPINSKDVKNV